MKNFVAHKTDFLESKEDYLVGFDTNYLEFQSHARFSPLNYVCIWLGMSSDAAKYLGNSKFRPLFNKCGNLLLPIILA